MKVDLIAWWCPFIVYSYHTQGGGRILAGFHHSSNVYPLIWYLVSLFAAIISSYHLRASLLVFSGNGDSSQLVLLLVLVFPDFCLYPCLLLLARNWLYPKSDVPLLGCSVSLRISFTLISSHLLSYHSLCLSADRVMMGKMPVMNLMRQLLRKMYMNVVQKEDVMSALMNDVDQLKLQFNSYSKLLGVNVRLLTDK